MDTHELDQTLRRILHTGAPAEVHAQAQHRFAALATQIGTPTPARAKAAHHAPRYWWWAGLGLAGTAALVALALGVFNSRLSAEVEFAGILSTKEKTLFYLVDRTNGTHSGWVGLQQNFAGYKLAGYDAKSDRLTLTREGEKKEVRLNEGKVQAASVEISGEVTLGAGETEEVTRATMIFDQENVFPMKNGVVVRITPTRLPNGNILYDMFFEHPDRSGKMQRLSAPSVISLPGYPFGIQIGEEKKSGDGTSKFDGVGFSFKPRKD
jgi:hypothetical protein